MLIRLLLLILAIIFLYFGAELSLGASEKIGKALKLSPFVIGMVIIGFGTSLPELFVGHIAASKGELGIALGSLVGSNIANMTLVLGLCALFTKLPLNGNSMFKHLVIHLILSLTLGYVLSGTRINIITTIPLLAIVFIYMSTIISDIKKGGYDEEKDEDFSPLKSVVFLIAGFGMLYGGGELLVYSGTKIAFEMGVSDYIVSSILIAFGTSFPELVTALLAAAKKKHTELIVGNIVGSNVFNCAFILGSLGIYDLALDGSFIYEVSVLVAGSILLCCLSVVKMAMNRIFGIIFLGLYVFIVGYWVSLY